MQFVVSVAFLHFKDLLLIIFVAEDIGLFHAIIVLDYSRLINSVNCFPDQTNFHARG